MNYEDGQFAEVHDINTNTTVKAIWFDDAWTLQDGTQRSIRDVQVIGVIVGGVYKGEENFKMMDETRAHTHLKVETVVTAHRRSVVEDSWADRYDFDAEMFTDEIQGLGWVYKP